MDRMYALTALVFLREYKANVMDLSNRFQGQFKVNAIINPKTTYTLVAWDNASPGSTSIGKGQCDVIAATWSRSFSPRWMIRFNQNGLGATRCNGLFASLKLREKTLYDIAPGIVTMSVHPLNKGVRASDC